MLFVDDDPLIRRAFMRALAPRGLVVDVAADGLEALSQAEQVDYSVVITDLAMPGIDGITLMRRLRKLSPDVVFVVVTGRPHVELPEDKALASAVTSVLTKPWDDEALFSTVQRALRRAETLGPLSHLPEPESPDDGTVLLVEDDDADADLVEFYVAARDRQQITRASRLDQAVALLEQRTFGVIVSDLSLPDARGLDTVLRLQRASPKVPLVVLTGLDDESLAIEAVQAGAQDYLAKDELSAASLRRAIRYARERKRSELRLAHMAHYDSLTGLANRTLFQQRLSHLLSRARRTGEAFSVMFIDLDKFKPVNDRHGHATGDTVLCEVAARLESVLRDYDTVARLGGDEFAALLDGVDAEQAAAAVAERILAELRRPVAFASGSVQIGASIGIASYPQAAQDAEGLLKAADKAMYLAKRGGRDCYRIFGQRREQLRGPSVRLVADLSDALARDEFELHYQPLLQAGTRRPAGAEALLRWRREGHGLVMPRDFLATLEASEEMAAVGRWVLRKACSCLSALRRQGAELSCVTINLAESQLLRGDLNAAVVEQLQALSLPPESLVFEITERVLREDPERMLTLLEQLHQLGVGLSLDDFGSGYSCLSMLHRLPIQSVKVDRVFVQNVGVSARAEAITRALCSLAKQLGLELIVEGVETEAQASFFEAEGCDYLQGFLFGRPAPAEEVFGLDPSGMRTSLQAG